MIRLFAITFTSILFVSCAVKKPLDNSSSQLIKNELLSDANSHHHVGFILKDLSNGSIILEQNADKNFTAASNMKIFTLWAGLNMLGDSVPTFQYVINKDSLIIWPMADPTFLNPKFTEQAAFNLLKNSGKDIYLVNGRYKGEKFGRGWAWDDYNESFQAEITEFPLYGNMMICKKNSKGKMEFTPDLSSLYFSESNVSRTAKTIKRSADNNNLIIPANLVSGYHQNIPIHFNRNISESLLTDTLLATGLITSSVKTLSWRAIPENAKTIYTANVDSVYKQMLHASDNFVAEQLMLNFAASNNLEMSTEAVVEQVKMKYLQDVTHKINWVDGSGLSRLNSISPKATIAVLEKINAKIDEKRIFDLFPAGGKSGTIQNMFKQDDGSTYIYAKSGSLSNTYNLSGFLIGKSGKKYAFSYLNNNYLLPTATIKAEVEKVLKLVYNNY